MADLPANATARLASSAATDNPTLILATPARLRRIIGYNAKASAVWLKLYDKATAPASTDVPRKAYYLPPGTGFAFDLDDYFIAGLGYRLVTGSADNDNTAVASGDILGLNLDYR
jgi:hypothetical protein